MQASAPKEPSCQGLVAGFFYGSEIGGGEETKEKDYSVLASFL